MSIYKEWGFTDSPFNTTALQPNDSGTQLLVGREEEMEQILRRLFNPPAAVTIEGLNGVGKTSAINVSLFNAYSRFFEGETRTLYIPCSRTFQLNIDKSIDDFINEVYYEIAQTLIKRSEELSNLGFKLPSDSVSVDKWLNSSHLSTWQATLGPLGAGRNSETNTSDGYRESGFKEGINGWLTEIFPTPDYGAVVCIIDNLELLETSDQAKKKLEILRDEIFNIPGIRWIFCGALGIIKSVVSTPRLEGYLHKPIEVTSVQRKFIKDLFLKRLKYYSEDINRSYMPIDEDQFDFLYEVLNENLRNTISYCDQYCMHTMDIGIRPVTKEDIQKEFLIWLQKESNDIYNAIEYQLRPRSRKLFYDVINFGGIFSPSDYDKFEFNSIAALRPQVLELERVGVLLSTVDESDNRRKTIQITPKGWLASYASKINNGT